jgi:hypothetical protein
MALTLVSGVIGANVDEVVAGATVGGAYVTGAGAPQPLGTTVDGVDGTRYTLVQAGSASSAMASTDAPNAYGIDADYRARLITSARAAAGQGLGFAPPKVIVAHDYFWARTAGSGFTARVAASAAADAMLRTTIVPGRLGTASTASAVVFPVVLVVAASASTSAGQSVREVYASRLAPIGVTADANSGLRAV